MTENSSITISGRPYRPDIQVEGCPAPAPADTPKFARGSDVEIFLPEPPRPGGIYRFALSSVSKGTQVGQSDVPARPGPVTIEAEVTSGLGDGLYVWSLFHVADGEGDVAAVASGSFNLVTLAGSDTSLEAGAGGLLKEEIS